MEKTAVQRPPGTEELLRRSIRDHGVIFPVLITTNGVLIDGELRKRIADELGKPCPTTIVRPVSNMRVSRMLEEDRLRVEAERDPQISGQIVRWAGQLDGNAVGLYPEEVIASAMGVSLQYVIDSMSRFLKPGRHDVRAMFPRERRTVSGRVAKAAVTTADVPPPAPVTPPMPKIHDVLNFLPEVTPEQFEALKQDIAANGQQVPVLITTHGELIDGRARWQACTDLGINPKVEVEHGNAWEVSLEANRVRFPNKWDRIMIVASLPVRNSPTMRNDRRAPTSEQAADLFRVQHYTTRTMRRIVSTANEAVISAIVSEKIRLGSATKIMREHPEEEWAERIEAEAKKARSRPKVDTPIPAPRTRRGSVTSAQILKIVEQFDALGMVLDSATGLDPAITSEQAAQWMSSLSTQRRHITRLTTMLKQRKETT